MVYFPVGIGNITSPHDNLTKPFRVHSASPTRGEASKKEAKERKKEKKAINGHDPTYAHNQHFLLTVFDTFKASFASIRSIPGRYIYSQSHSAVLVGKVPSHG